MTILPNQTVLLSALTKQYRTTSSFFSDLSEAEQQWLIDAGLGAYATDHLSLKTPILQNDWYAAIGEESLRKAQFIRVGNLLHDLGIPVVVFKGMALALTIYPEKFHRTMTDIDLWLIESTMDNVISKLEDAQFNLVENPIRPPNLQKLVRGELSLVNPQSPHFPIDLHFSPFHGWWMTHASKIEIEKLGDRLVQYETAGLPWPIYTLAPEDNLLQLIFHLVINHQFGLNAVRTMVDISLLSQHTDLNWDIIVKRAQSWEIATAVWLALDTIQQLVPIKGLHKAHLDKLKPNSIKQTLLKKIITPNILVNQIDISATPMRFPFLLIIVDKFQMMINLIANLLFPSKEWRLARYGQSTSKWEHLKHIIRQRNI